ncbi:Uncharacterised protein [Salmonella enterica subsp. arizonae]|nr:Uncharacterised protein [Salmonella enterica subsp. arizonae]
MRCAFYSGGRILPSLRLKKKTITKNYPLWWAYAALSLSLYITLQAENIAALFNELHAEGVLYGVLSSKEKPRNAGL